MKILEINDDYYYCPDEFSDIESFVSYLNEHFNSFIGLTMLDTQNCVFPYFIKEETKETYLNISAINRIIEVNGTVLCREDYDNRLRDVIKKKCVDCRHYEDGDELEEHCDKLCLDGNCWGYIKKD